MLTACGPEPEAVVTPAPPTATNTQAPPTSTPTQTPTPTATLLPSSNIDATVWENDPFTVILTYHQFAENIAGSSSSVKVRFEDYANQLQDLYDSGYSLVSLDDWMKGNMVIPEGRRPLIFSMDDLFYRNQILFDENGDIEPNTGIGMHWDFYQENPDFGFSWALFTNLGDKFYPDGAVDDGNAGLAYAVVWCIEHNSMIYNHTFHHPDLSNAPTNYLQAQLIDNDAFLRGLLVTAGREDLIPQLKNIIALPFGEWPEGYMGMQALLDYTTSEGVLLQGVMEIDYVFRVVYLPPMHHEDYDPLAMPRVVSNPDAVDWLVANKDNFEQAQVCALGEVPDIVLDDPEYLAEHILNTYNEAECSTGTYVVRNFLFNVSEDKVELITTWQE